MIDKNIAVIIVCVIIFILVLRREKFVSKKEKADAMLEWFENNEPNYSKYKRRFGGDANIVEYEDVLRLKKNNNMTADKIASTI